MEKSPDGLCKEKSVRETLFKNMPCPPLSDMKDLTTVISVELSVEFVASASICIPCLLQ